ncbi:MAG: glycosyltransferase family 4 protein [Solirubrobacteraceae bacterium]|nr:glycosyltransferase family 4 protein [Solirubrobacteraceae bacterium]
MLVQLVDPAAYTPPYDHALATALVRAGAEVELITTASPDWEAATGAAATDEAVPVGMPGAPAWAAAATRAGGATYTRRLDFYRRSAELFGSGRLRQLARAVEHPAGLRRLRARPADLTHVQWAPVQEIDHLALPKLRPLVITAHDILPREARTWQRAAQRAIYERAQLVIAHSDHGRQRLIDEAGVPEERIRVIPHGAFEHLALTPRAPLPAELGRTAGGDEPQRPVVLSFGLIRPYKATDVLLRAWRQVNADAELWIVGKPRGVDLDELRALADHRVRFVPRFVTDGELAACFDAAQITVLPYREIEQSGVLATSLAFGLPTVATAVGAFPEAEAHGALTTVPPGDEPALAAALERLLADPTERAILTAGARRLALGPWSWEAVAGQHLQAYRELLGDRADAKVAGLR